MILIAVNKGSVVDTRHFERINPLVLCPVDLESYQFALRIDKT
ncbi:hypothetical protein SDC9_103211 [bioreactor metagenome]|uniref:Uncharacterized protein n=1 Tax=bioreactor metagenome TaxID=1076179 RepID=A0A645AUG3_9ZZZZ